MSRGFQPARRTGGTVPRIISMVYTTGQTFKKGALLVDDAAGTVVECGADPVAIRGVSLAAAGSGLGYDLANTGQTTVVTGRLQEVSVAVADREQEWSCRGVNGGTDPVLPLQTHIGEQYGVAKVGTDWVMDLAETTTKSVEVTDVTEAQGGDPGMFIVKFLEAALALP